MTMSPSINYAEQVLREEAERIAKLKEEAASNFAASKSTFAAKTETAAKVNLKDENDFPTLGKAKGKIIISQSFKFNTLPLIIWFSDFFSGLGYFYGCTG